MAALHRVQGARRATVLRYGGSLWVNGYWPNTTMSIELRPVRRARGRLILLGPPTSSGRSIAVDLGVCVSAETFANELAEWIETPALSVRRAEQLWSRIAGDLAADLANGTLRDVPA